MIITDIMKLYAQVDFTNVGDIQNVFWHGRLKTSIDLFLRCFLWLLTRFFWCLFFINFPPCYLFRPVFVVRIVRVGRVEERELWVVTLSLTNLLLELRWVRGASNESGSSINYGCKDTKQMHTVSNYLGHRL